MSRAELSVSVNGRRLHSVELGLNYETVLSAPLLDTGDNAANTVRQYIERIYKRLTPELRLTTDMPRLLQQVSATGVEMCRQLLDSEVTRRFWPLRGRIKLIRIVSWEPYIPCELVRLAQPDTAEIDHRSSANTEWCGVTRESRRR